MTEHKLMLSGDLTSAELHIYGSSEADWSTSTVRLSLTCAEIESVCDLDKLLNSYVTVTIAAVPVPPSQEPA